MKKLVFTFVLAIGLLFSGTAFGQVWHGSLLGDVFTGDNGEKNQNHCNEVWKEGTKKVNGMTQWTCEDFNGQGDLKNQPSSVVVDDDNEIKIAIAVAVLPDENAARSMGISVAKDFLKMGCKGISEFSNDSTLAFRCPDGTPDHVIVVKNNLLMVMYMNSLGVFL